MIKGGLQMQNNSNIAGNEIIIYQTEDGHTKIDVKFEDEKMIMPEIKPMAEIEVMTGKIIIQRIIILI